jgi:peptidoglycan-associated lipoprotein
MDGSGINGGGVGTTGLPGSRADFLASVPPSGSCSKRTASVLMRKTAPSWMRRPPGYSAIQAFASPSRVMPTSAARASTISRSAIAVRMPPRNYLAARGVSPARMNVISWGKERPVALGSDAGSWAQNRRAVTVLPQ